MTAADLRRTENNLFLVKRLIERTEIRNTDPGPRRYTSLAWAAALGHEETFEFLLSEGHDDYEYSRVRVVALATNPRLIFRGRMQKTTPYS